MQKHGRTERHCMFERGESRVQGSVRPRGCRGAAEGALRGQLLCFCPPFALAVRGAATISVLLLQFALSMRSWSESHSLISSN